MGLIRDLMVPPCPKDDEWMDYRPGGIHDHDRSTIERFWARIYKRFEDRALCQQWWDYRSHHSMEAWTYGFTEMTYQMQDLAREGVKLQRPFPVAKRYAENYDRNPDLCKKLAERRRQHQRNRVADAPPPPVIIAADRREWWEEYYRRQRARKTG